jgi:hypothetical protein
MRMATAVTQREVHILNLGAGVQSTTLYLMFLRGEIKPCIDYAIFADTGEEPGAVYEHLAWLRSLRGPPILVRSTGQRLGDDLKRGTMTRKGTRFVSIPAYTIMPGSEEEGRTRRQCSKEYKIEVIERTIRREICGLAPGRRLPKSMKVAQYVGISVDEAGRFTRLQRRRTLGRMAAPLIERHMTRQDCLQWLAERGNVPHEVPRSACVFCPFHDDAEWERVKRVPEDWARAVEIDEALRTVGIANNIAGEMFLHRSCQPLVQIEFKPKEPVPHPTFGFWREDSFSRECLGVCGL